MWGSHTKSNPKPIDREREREKEREKHEQKEWKKKTVKIHSWLSQFASVQDKWILKPKQSYH